jgi:hypothetical protein
MGLLGVSLRTYSMHMIPHTVYVIHARTHVTISGIPECARNQYILGGAWSVKNDEIGLTHGIQAIRKTFNTRSQGNGHFYTDIFLPTRRGKSSLIDLLGVEIMRDQADR